ncbi:Na(+)/H(+) antiporter subunit D [Actinomadura livida]|uniref:Multicomponent Na+:H+ antiporter subunit D n=1 Tax=Actinomadura livida TaxID=79909 RepID=A0A7W7I7P9_9ACTN|nr:MULTISPECIES: Na(+)/H(+) antiporter subunit D [Actinomadura]MBB4772062.1 multicomponent Na+:H+ antiporter subunit D [Actinomadura catellatispora]GGU04432.1 Na(+)/H(+) antiporter subunit D [Actinomadura livida]
MTINPALLLIAGALPIPLLRGRLRAVWMMLLAPAALAALWTLPEGVHGSFEILGLQLETLRVDALARIFATAFLAAALISMVYALHLRDALQQTVIPIYASSAVGGALAGDLITLFVFWELAGLSSVFLIWAQRTERAYRAGMRYLVAQVASGLLMLGGIVLHVNAGGGLEFGFIGASSAGGLLILLAVGIKCAFPILHAWLTDTYPEATIVGTVALSAFTTKFAVYVLARGFPGTGELVWVGVVMACFPIFYAVIENDLRRVLAYSMINQLGFMVAAVGVGGTLGVNGAAAHAFADILFKGLLFMSMGAVLLRTGTAKGSELGGLYKSMPQTMVLCVIGAASISAFPLFSGFATKSIIMEAVAEEHRTIVWLLLLFASAGVFHHAGIKIPFFSFFAHDRGHRVAEAPLNMRVAMGLAAAGSILIGVAPNLLYGLLPYEMDYSAYTTSHVINQVQLLLLASMAFTVLMRTGLYPPELPSVNLDADVIYRRLLPRLWRTSVTGLTRLRDATAPLHARAGRLTSSSTRPLQTASWTTDVMVLWVALLLALFLLISLL